MSVEELIRAEVEAAVSTVPDASPAPLDSVRKRGRRRLIVTRVALAVAGVAVCAAVVGVSMALGRIGYVPDVAATTVPSATTVPDADGAIELAGDQVSVDGVVEAFADAPIYSGELAPAPGFDTSGYGEKQPLAFGQVKVADDDVLDGPTVYLGEASEQSVFLKASDSVSGSAKCLWVGPTPEFCGDSGTFQLTASSQEGLYAAWLRVPEGTSIVVLRDTTGTRFWQRPVSGVALVSLPNAGAYEMAALNQAGEELETIQLSADSNARQDAPGPGEPTTTLP